MECVVDASVAVAWFVEQPNSAAADNALNQFDFYAPSLILPEIGNAMWKYKRHGVISESQFRDCLVGLAGAYFFVEEMDDTVMHLATGISADLDHPIYDCVYLAVARKLKTPFLTADKKLINKLSGNDFEIIALQDMDAAS